MNKSRSLKNTLLELSSSYLGRIIVLTGARQVGKTTLLQNIFPDYTYISFDDPSIRVELAQLTASQWKKAYPKAILDEVQKMPQIIELIKAIYDQGGEERYILTGSSQILLLNQVKETLAGRSSIFEMYPLTLPEIQTLSWDESPRYSLLQSLLLGQQTDPMPSLRLEPDFASRMEAFEHYLQYGGFPSLVAHRLNNKEKFKWLENYVKTYLERDVRDLADFRRLDPFIALQRICALQTGQLVNFSTLAREAGVQGHTAQRFLSYLSISYQIVLLQPWYRNPLKRLSKMPKIHFLDMGIQRILAQNQSRNLNGNEFESAIFAEIYKQVSLLDISCRFYHLRTSDGREVDLLLELEKGYIAIEFKQTSKIVPTDARHLRNLELILDKPIIKSYVLSNDYQHKVLGDNIEAFHAGHFLT